MRWDVTIARVQDLVGQGVPKKEIARRLSVSPATVRDRLSGRGPDKDEHDARIPTERLRDVIAPGQAHLLALRLGWEESKVRACLGEPCQRAVSLADALALLDAAGVDPREAGL